MDNICNSYCLASFFPEMDIHLHEMNDHLREIENHHQEIKNHDQEIKDHHQENSKKRSVMGLIGYLIKIFYTLLMNEKKIISSERFFHPSNIIQKKSNINQISTKRSEMTLENSRVSSERFFYPSSRIKIPIKRSKKPLEKSFLNFIYSQIQLYFLWSSIERFFYSSRSKTIRTKAKTRRFSAIELMRLFGATTAKNAVLKTVLLAE